MDQFSPPSASLRSPSPSPVSEGDALPPRPGWAKAVGVGHVVTATLSSVGLVISLFWVVIAMSWTKPAAGGPSLLVGMDHPRYLWFVGIDVATGLICNGLTFAVGLALLNLRAWGARTWDWLAPTKIGRLVLVWGGFVVFVAPVLASTAGAAIIGFIRQSAGPGQKLPTVGEMTLIYAWMFLAMGIGMIVLGSIYPAVTWWAIRRRGLRAALVEADSAPPRVEGGMAP